MERNIEIEQTQETDMKVEMVVIAEHGLGFGDGSTSTHAQMESGELTREALVVAHEVITGNEGVFTDIDADITDDGCGDGRPTVDTWVTDEDGQEIHYNKSYPRAKIFGGGLVVASSMWRVWPVSGITASACPLSLSTSAAASAFPTPGKCDP